jgi:hypothetical protein
MKLQQDILKESVALLRQQFLLTADCLEKFKNLKEALKHSNSGAGVTSAVQALEPFLREFDRLQKQQDVFLQRMKMPRLADIISSQPDSEERAAALRLLDEAAQQSEKLRAEIVGSDVLLKHSKKFIDFNVNLMSGTTASATYGPGSAAYGEVRDRKMFDANI